MNATPVNREAIRMLVLSVGYKRTAEQTGIKEATIRQWAHRGKWFAQPQPHAQAVTTVNKAPADVLLTELAENEKQTRLSLSRYAARASKDAESATLRDAKLVKAVAETADKTFPGWLPDKKGEQQQVAVNIAILGV